VTREFETKFAEYIGVKNALAVTSASTGLELGLRVLGIGPGDEIIAPDFTYPITASVAYQVGAEPVLVDIDDVTYAMKPSEVEKAITEKTKCIIPVSLFGNPVNLKPLRELQDENNFVIFEDAARPIAAGSVGARLHGKVAGSQADLACYSFHPRKIITTGEGGMLTTNNDELAEHAHSFKHFGTKVLDGKVQFVEHGTNYKLSNILAAIGLEQLKKIDAIIKERQEMAKVYDQFLEDFEFLRRPQVLEGAECSYQSYTTLMLKEGIRDNIIQDMRKEGIETQIGTYALSLQPAFKNVKKIGELATSKKVFRNTLTLPLYHGMTQAEQEIVCNTLNKVVGRY